MSRKTLISLRLDPDLLRRVDDYARAQDWVRMQGRDYDHVRGGMKPGDIGRTAMVTELLEALVEGRLVVHPREGVSPFPAEDAEIGSAPSCPAYIWMAPPPEPSRRGWHILQNEGHTLVNPSFRRDPETGRTHLVPAGTDTDSGDGEE